MIELEMERARARACMACTGIERVRNDAALLGDLITEDEFLTVHAVVVRILRTHQEIGHPRLVELEDEHKTLMRLEMDL